MLRENTLMLIDDLISMWNVFLLIQNKSDCSDKKITNTHFLRVKRKLKFGHLHYISIRSYTLYLYRFYVIYVQCVFIRRFCFLSPLYLLLLSIDLYHHHHLPKIYTVSNWMHLVFSIKYALLLKSTIFAITIAIQFSSISFLKQLNQKINRRKMIKNVEYVMLFCLKSIHSFAFDIKF